VLFLEVRPGDVSDFAGALKVRGLRVGAYRVLRTRSHAAPNALAAFLLRARDKTGRSRTSILGGRRATRSGTC
jgi:hypothetical protein